MHALFVLKIDPKLGDISGFDRCFEKYDLMACEILKSYGRPRGAQQGAGFHNNTFRPEMKVTFGC